MLSLSHAVQTVCAGQAWNGEGVVRIHLKEPMDGWASLKLFELAGGSAGGEDERLFGTTEPGKPKRAITAAAEQATPREPDAAPRPPRSR